MEATSGTIGLAQMPLGKSVTDTER